MRATRNELVTLLAQGRKFDNETVRDASQMASWRRRVDRALEGEVGDDPEERYDEPKRAEHRRAVARMFR